MGGSTYSSAAFTSRVADNARSGKSFFAHDADIRSGKKPVVVHELLDPSKPNLAGKLIRESLDSDLNPNSRAIAVLFDVTGSMGIVPRTFKDKLPKFMSVLTQKAYVADPHVLFGAIGDAYSDRMPLQLGQFESGNEVDEAFSNIYLEGYGGGQRSETYELGMYYMARHTKMDCLDKRGKKGYLFLMGDETPYDVVNREHVKRIIGDNLEADIPLEDILAECKEKFHVFWIFPEEGSYSNDPNVTGMLKKLFGERFIMMERSTDVCEVIATLIGVTEGYDINSVSKDLVDAGVDADAVGRASTAVTAYAGSSALAKHAQADGTLVAAGESSQDEVARL